MCNIGGGLQWGLRSDELRKGCLSGRGWTTSLFVGENHSGNLFWGRGTVQSSPQTLNSHRTQWVEFAELDVTH